MPEQRASHSFAPFLHLLFEGRPIPTGEDWGIGSRPGQSIGGASGSRASTGQPGSGPGPTRPAVGSGAGPFQHSPASTKAKKPPDPQKHPGGTPALTPEAQPWPGDHPDGFLSAALGCSVPLLPPPSRLPTTSPRRPVHGWKRQDAFGFIECMMSLTRDQTYLEEVSFSGGFWGVEAA